MKKYDTIKDLSANEFKRLTGVSKFAFQTMLTVIIKAGHQRMQKAGKPFQLNTEDRLLLTLEYLREYRTYFQSSGMGTGTHAGTKKRLCKMSVVEGSYANIKVTPLGDLDFVGMLIEKHALL